MTETVLGKLNEQYSMDIIKNAPMAGYTTFSIGGAADYAVFPKDISTFEALCCELDKHNIDYLTVGNGSNILLPDEGYRGAVIVTTKINRISVDGKKVTAECGSLMTKLSRAACEASLTGLEFMFGIPGTVGGGVYMNAGAYGGEVSSVIKEVRVYDRCEKKTVTFSSNECDFSYRNSIFEKNGARYMILEAIFELEEGNKEEISAVMNELMARRREKQPLEYPSAGSAFKRLPGYFTAKLIDDAGLKGYSIGGAAVSEKHAGFIINKGAATADDVKKLIAHIQKVIYEKYSLEIESEIRIIENRQ